MVCHEGRGRILLDGRWQTSRAGVACLAPPRVLNAFHAVAGSRWRFAWIRYDEPEHVRPVVSASSPVRVRCCRCLVANPFGTAGGVGGRWEPRALHHWIELAHGEARRIAQPWHVDDRLWTLWDDVSHDIAADWTLAKLAVSVRASKEQFRRVCLRELGRSPMQHLTSLRIERACQLLSATADKVEAIAQQVGFENASVFSPRFRRAGSAAARRRTAADPDPVVSRFEARAQPPGFPRRGAVSAAARAASAAGLDWARASPSGG